MQFPINTGTHVHKIQQRTCLYKNYTDKMNNATNKILVKDHQWWNKTGHAVQKGCPAVCNWPTRIRGGLIGVIQSHECVQQSVTDQVSPVRFSEMGKVWFLGFRGGG